MTEKKITKREKFEMLRTYVQDNAMLTEFIDHEIELLSKKSAPSDKRNEEQERFFEVIRDVLAECGDTVGLRCSAILKDERVINFLWKDGKEITSQRLSAMLSKLVACGDVIKSTEKKDVYFRLA